MYKVEDIVIAIYCLIEDEPAFCQQLAFLVFASNA